MRAFRVLLAGALVGCATLVTIDGFQVDQEMVNKYFPQVKSRGSFDMKCPETQLSLKILAASERGMPQQVGVSGCGRDLTYVYTVSGGFVLNSESGAAK